MSLINQLAGMRQEQFENPERLLLQRHPLARAGRQLNFFHGVAGKYNLDCPTELPLVWPIWKMPLSWASWVKAL